MERESFEDEAIATLMNEHYVNIKVDREERPDIDDIYMAATVAMNNGQGGWPMTVFLTPSLQPVFAGTYFPPRDQYGRPGFATLLREVARAWREGHDQMRERAARFAEQLRERRSLGPALAVGEDELELALHQYAEDFDATHGGFGDAPKFPPAESLSLLLRLHQRLDDKHALLMVETTLNTMARGGLYDHVGGGFARYSTDRQWLVPHFEKMLYDNALLARVYLEGFQVTGQQFYRQVATETLDYVLREMTAAEGGFYSSTDADSEGEEGKFFVWTPEEIADILGEKDARLFNTYYDITAGGNWEGKNIPNTPRSLYDVAREFGLEADELLNRLVGLRDRVYEARSRRVRPGLDDKILTAWNGLMIGAMANGSRVLGEARYLEGAREAADFVLGTLRRDDGALLRTYREGKAHLNAYLEDYAFLADGLIDLYEAGGDAPYLRHAERLVERILTDFGENESSRSGSAFYNTAADHEHLLMRYRDGSDGATPSANAVAASALGRLSYHLDRADFREASIGAIKAYGRTIAQFPRAFARSLSVVDLLLESPIELAFVGRRGTADLEALRREVARHYLPNRIEAVGYVGDETTTASSPSATADALEMPLLRGKIMVDDRAALYVCRDFTCKAPVTRAAEVADALATYSRSDAVSTIAIPLVGRATKEGTARYGARFGGAGYRNLGAAKLTVSLLGFGGYRTDDETPEHREAMAQAVLSGVNLIDTSSNYMDGASERLVGGVLRGLVDDGKVQRDEVIVVSKIGYVQGANYRLAREREARGAPFPEVVKMHEGLWHSIHPVFLDDQLRRSLDRLELDVLDVCLLHNPEYFLIDAAKQGMALQEARAEFYGRLERAFRYLEGQVENGRVGCYGVSSNTVVTPASDADATSLTQMLEAAQRAVGDGEEHHFRILQLPLNLFEVGAALERNDGADGLATVLAVAESQDIAVLANRPLNASVGGRVVRLVVAPVEGEVMDVDSQLARVAELEETYRSRIAPDVPMAPDAIEPDKLFRWAEQLREINAKALNLEQWSGIQGQVLSQAGQVALFLHRQLTGPVHDRWDSWREQYLPELERLLAVMGREVAETALAQSTVVNSVISPLLPVGRMRAALSQKALWAVASTPGVTTVLNGMRTPAYVEEALEVMEWPALANVEEVYQAVRDIKVS
jgi:uncharacterized protein YyaL (SSP411 family)/aryl-alcohol dehydrogenase-like predicted oxidoreductase